MQLSRIESLFRLFREAYRPYKTELFWLTILGLVSAVLEGIGVNAIIPLFSFVSGDAGAASNFDFISRAIMKFFEIIHLSFSLKYLLIFMCALFVAKAIVLVIFNYINVAITSDYEKDARTRLFSDTLLAKWPYLIGQKIGYLEQVLVTDIARSAALLRQLVGMILMITNLIIYLAVAINISPLITILTLVIGAVLFLFFKPLFYRARVAARKQADYMKRTAHLINENMLGAKAVKAGAKED